MISIGLKFMCKILPPYARDRITTEISNGENLKNEAIITRLHYVAITPKDALHLYTKWHMDYKIN